MSSVLKHAAAVVAEIKIMQLINNHHKHTLIQICTPDAQYNQRYAYQPQPPPTSAYPGPSNDSVKSEYGYTNHDGYEPVNNNTNYQSPFNDRYKY